MEQHKKYLRLALASLVPKVLSGMTTEPLFLNQLFFDSLLPLKQKKSGVGGGGVGLLGNREARSTSSNEFGHMAAYIHTFES